MRAYSSRSVSRSLWLKEEMDEELRKLVDEGYFFSISEAMRVGVFIVILLARLNPEALRALRELADEIRRLNQHLESKQVGNFYQLWRNVINIG